MKNWTCLCIAVAGLLAGAPISKADGEKIEIKYLFTNSRQKDIDAFKTAQKLSSLKPDNMTIYFFDTLDLKLLKQGLILRLRQKGGKWALTIKQRPAPSDAARSGSGEMVEEETIGGNPIAAYSTNIDLTDAQAQQAIAGKDLATLFAKGQPIFSKYKLNWPDIHVTSKITSTRWDLSSQLNKLDAEEWDFQGQRILELSVSGKADKRTKHEADFQDFLNKAGIKGTSGGMKTTTVLQTTLKK